MLGDPFPRWLTHMPDVSVLALVRRSQLFATWPFYKAALGVCSQNTAAGLPRARWPRERKEVTMLLMTQSGNSNTSISAIFYSL